MLVLPLHPPPINIVDSGLIMNLDAGDIASYLGTGTTWTNLINPSSNNGTLINGVGYSALNQGSLTFDGINDRCTFTSPITANSFQTYEVWIKGIPSNSSDIEIVYILHNNNTNNWIGSAYMGIGYVGNTSASSPLQNREIYAAFNGQWLSMGVGVIGDTNTVKQIVFTWDGTNQIAYVDGTQRVYRPLSSMASNFSTTIGIGDERTTTFRQIQGNVYSIKVYNRALSSSEVQQNFDALRGRYEL